MYRETHISKYSLRIPLSTSAISNAALKKNGIFTNTSLDILTHHSFSRHLFRISYV